MAKLFLEVIIAPEASDEARAALAGKAALRLLVTGGMPDPLAPGVNLRSLAGGYLLQKPDGGRVPEPDLPVRTKRPPASPELAAPLFPFPGCNPAKSNALLFPKSRAPR